MTFFMQMLVTGIVVGSIYALVALGFVLIYKRLSVPGGYQWPGKQSEVRNLTWREFDWLMSGIDIDQPKALKME